ncbi:hypothetical protein Taro_045027 [Colocasia esculenta]|uniref:Uncharacterized protein n=1 Tax=Colocasia esculenta TaxID=4460 RepID=A0A843WKV4_COLES|nr:hypothetical protein [Colocasia esculenta]
MVSVWYLRYRLFKPQPPGVAGPEAPTILFLSPGRGVPGISSAVDEEASSSVTLPASRVLPWPLKEEDAGGSAMVASVERFAYKGVASNLVTYLTDHVKLGTSAAAKSVNNWSGVTSLMPLVGAFLADSYCDRYSTILGSSFVYVAVSYPHPGTTNKQAWSGMR